MNGMAQSPHPILQEDNEEDGRLLFTLERGGIERAANFYFYRVPEGRSAVLEEKIRDHGGEIIYDKSERSSADVLLAHTAENLAYVEKLCKQSRTAYARRTRFVEDCINGNRFELIAPAVKAMPGRPPGSQRTEFIAQDDQHLVEYVGEVVPFKARGGRKGNVIYQDLCSNPRVYPWAQRHPWQSWQNRYKKNEEEFDELIDIYVQEHPPEPNGKGQYYRDARLRKGDRTHPIILDSEDEHEDEEQPGDDADQAGAAENHHVPHMQPRQEEEEEEDANADVQMVQDVPSSSPSPAPEALVRQRQTAAASRKRARPTDNSAGDRLSANQTEKRRRMAHPARPQREPQEDAADADFQHHPNLEDEPTRYPGKGEEGPSQPRRQQVPAPSRPLRQQARAASQPREGLQTRSGRTLPTTQIPASSQATLVATQPPTQAVKAATRRQPAPPPPSTPPLPPPRQSPPVRQAQHDTRGYTSQQAVKKTAPRTRLPPPVDAPSRNTRARSRTVDPPQPSAPVRTEAQTRAQGRGRIESVIEEVVEESEQEEEQDAHMDGEQQHHHEREDEGDQGGVAHDETMEVEAELVAGYDSDEHDAVSIQRLSPDDAQTSLRLQTPPPQAPVPEFSASPIQAYEPDSDDEIIAAVAPRSRPFYGSEPAPPSSSRRATIHSRQSSLVSEEEIFPSRNTKARMVRDQLEAAAKAAPYVPPEGTRARKAAVRSRK